MKKFTIKVFRKGVRVVTLIIEAKAKKSALENVEKLYKRLGRLNKHITFTADEI